MKTRDTLPNHADMDGKQRGSMESKRQNSSMAFPDGLDSSEDGVRLVSLTFGVTLYTSVFFTEISKQVLACFEMFLRLCSRDQLRYYATTNMRMHKPITPRTFGMLETWLKPGAPPMDFIDLEMKNGVAYQDAPDLKFAVCAGGKGSLRHAAKHANMVSVAFPAEWGIQRAEEMLGFVRDLCSLFPFQSGHAGISFECSRYAKTDSQTHAWQKSMRHRGIDIVRIPADAKAAGHDALKGVGWLTLLGKPLAAELGGTKSMHKSLPGEVEFIEAPTGGLILKAGPVPMIGDRNRDERLPLYGSVYRVVAPLVEVAAERSMAFNLLDDYVERTMAWYRRLSDE